ncbi:hypothetical protein [Embleya sp. NPDC020886]|uniref:hypothetical protein n=1 Tax=Embleya sp. NPDC020886 TaxID=3363980 RepID=UPI00379EE57E
MDGPSLSGRERRVLARLEKSLLQDEQFVALWHVFEDPIDPKSGSAPRRRRVRVRVRVHPPRRLRVPVHVPVRALDRTRAAKWSALTLSGAAMAMLVAAVLTASAVVDLVAIGMTVLTLCVVGLFGYLRWLRLDAPGAARVPHGAHPSHAPGRTHTADDRGADPDDRGPDPGPRPGRGG